MICGQLRSDFMISFGYIRFFMAVRPMLHISDVSQFKTFWKLDDFLRLLTYIGLTHLTKFGFVFQGHFYTYFHPVLDTKCPQNF